jgi:hypothetical protein
MPEKIESGGIASSRASAAAAAKSFSAQSAVPPLLPVILTLVIAAIVIAVVLAWMFPGIDENRAAPMARFTDVAEDAGLRFVHHQGGVDAPTTLGGAVVVLDFDNDGRPDLFFVNGAPWPWDEPLAKRVTNNTCALYHNDGHGHFSDYTALAGLNVELQGMSAAAGDFDGDGLTDLFVTCIGSNHLFRNRGRGRFEDVTEEAKVGGEENTWSTGATWIDYDGDGRLDLVVAHYARWPEEVGLSAAFNVAAIGRSYGTPTGFLSAFPSVYRNLGGGKFALVPGAVGLRDIDRQSGLPVARPLAIAPVDANGDGKLDLLFSYHTSENALFLNQGDGAFRKWSVGRDDRHEGAAVGFAAASGLPMALGAESDDRLMAFQAADSLVQRGRGHATIALTAKFGFASLDYDLDGRPEIFSGEGRAEPDVNKFEADRDFWGAPRLLWNGGNAWRPAPVPASEGAEWTQPIVARGIATLDFDGDGDLDVVVAQNGGPPLLLRNDQRLNAPWLRVHLVATRSHPEAGGAKVEVHTPRRVFVQTIAPAMGFMAQSESTLTFGLGEDTRVRKIVIRWPSGQRQEVHPDGTNRTLVIREQ